MAANSFDITSGFDKAEVNNVFNQTDKELKTRYDLKSSACEIAWLSNQTGFKIIAPSEWQIDTIIEIIRKKIATRGLSQQLIDSTKENVVSNLKVTKELPIKQTLEKEDISTLTKLIKLDFPKIKLIPSGDYLRVESNSRDELQKVIGLLKNKPVEFSINFTNFK